MPGILQMNSKTIRKVKRYGWIAPAAALLFVGLLMFSGAQRAPVVRLADGTEFTLGMVAFTNTYNYSQQWEPAWMRRFSKVIPDVIEKRFIKPGGTIGMGTSTETNLMVAVEASNNLGPVTRPEWLRITDEAGNSVVGNTRDGMLSSGNSDVIRVWIVSESPRRSRTLFLEPLVHLANGTWTNIGPFQIKNPFYGKFPQWNPEPLPQTRTNDGLTATLVKLISGSSTSSIAQGAPASPANPRSTRMEFSFSESGRPVDHYRIHQLTISDATGNKWSPYLGINNARAGWTTNGAAEFVGALWPGEDAWKIELQALRNADFAGDEIWSPPVIPLPNQQTHDDLTNRFEVDGLSIQLANIQAPGVQITNSWQWIVRYWGQEPSVYAMGVKFDDDMRDRRLVVVEAKDQLGEPFKLVEKRGADYPQQALFLQSPEGATELHLKLAFPKLKKFEYLAHPEFVGLDKSVEAPR